ncbi:MAG: ATP-dependent DNA helicase RecG, partial [Candidatus Krumholzibacteria bacterium]|nr:ATP-dependent DNA helicase RecG [Candidatus Krumholzibacteria bacterium]
MANGENGRGALLTSSQYVKGVGPARQRLLSRLGIETVLDLVMHFPRGYFDRSDLVSIAGAAPGRTATVRGEVVAVHPRRLGPRRSMLTVAVDDGTGALRLVFFNQPYLERAFRAGTRVIASGEVRLFRGEKQITAPEWERTGEGAEEDLIHAGRIVPVYPLTAGISQRMMRRIVREALDRCEGVIEENLPRNLIEDLALPGRAEAIRQIHYPDDMIRHREAMRRMKFEEVFFLHLLIHERRMKIRSGAPRPAVPPPHTLAERFIAGLPFRLTAAQRRALGEITADVESAEGLARLLQGDVGSGKTVVAVAAMLLAVGAGHQAALMVPTEILADQHARRIGPALEALGVRCELLIGSMSAAVKETIHGRIADGLADVVVGTHALIQEGIRFRQLGLAVIDEQHRFGVRQRATLGRGDIIPHFLVMTATPIPRSLAQTVYGDLDLSVIDELPSPRRVRTELVPGSRIDAVYEDVRADLRRGGQAFILYPLVEESERIDLRAATAEFERLGREVFPDLPIGLLHGRMSFEEKARAIELFREGAIRALVTTTVIEVGVDIPGASILLINHPERFGLAQLHQLRGRVGRGGSEGVCYLLIGDETGAAAQERLGLFAGTDDGFRVAEIDLRLRGPGEIWGTRQSGYPTFRLINPLADRDLVER